MDDGCKYKGLINQGSTSHLNSVLQVLFMTKEFREAVERVNCENGSLDFHLKNLFIDLKKYTGHTNNVTKKLGIISENVSCDAAECLQNILSGLTSPDASQLFKGIMTLKNQCSECKKETIACEPFWILPLKLVDGDEVFNVVDGVIKYFCEPNLRGPNNLYCEDCATKASSTYKREIKNHPEMLTLLMDRFRYDYNLMTDVKAKCSIQIPRCLQIPPRGDQSHIYEVYAFVEHVGELRNGHHTVTIKSQDDDKWYLFSDNWVTMSYYQPFQVNDEEKNQSAYLLFYRKVPAKRAFTQDIDEESSIGRFKKEVTEQSESDTEITHQSKTKTKAAFALSDFCSWNRKKEEEQCRYDIGGKSVRTEVVKHRDEYKTMTKSRVETLNILTKSDYLSGIKKNGRDCELSVYDIAGIKNGRTTVHKQKDEEMITTHTRTGTLKLLTKSVLRTGHKRSDCEQSIDDVIEVKEGKTSLVKQKDEEKMIDGRIKAQKSVNTSRFWTRNQGTDEVVGIENVKTLRDKQGSEEWMTQRRIMTPIRSIKTDVQIGRRKDCGQSVGDVMRLDDDRHTVHKQRDEEKVTTHRRSCTQKLLIKSDLWILKI